VTTLRHSGRPTPVPRTGRAEAVPPPSSLPGPVPAHKDTPSPSGVYGDADVGAALPRILTVIGTIVAPTTLVTALLFYFGRLHATGLFRHLRVPATVFDLSLQDYLVRSADGLFVPFTVSAGSILFLVWVTVLIARVLPSTRRQAITRRLAPVIGLGGLVLICTAVADVADSPMFVPRPEAPGLYLATGIVLLALSIRPTFRRVPRSVALLTLEWGAVFLVVAIGLFWSVGEYAIGVGQTRGQQITDSLASTPDAVLFSDKDLGITSPGVTRKSCVATDAAYHYRYDGLKLIFQANNQYLFLPTEWTRSQGSAILIPRTDSLRLEFSAPDTPKPADC